MTESPAGMLNRFTFFISEKQDLFKSIKNSFSNHKSFSIDFGLNLDFKFI